MRDSFVLHIDHRGWVIGRAHELFHVPDDRLDVAASSRVEQRFLHHRVGVRLSGSVRLGEGMRGIGQPPVKRARADAKPEGYLIQAGVQQPALARRVELASVEFDWSGSLWRLALHFCLGA